MAERADRHALYQQAVQYPAYDLGFFCWVHRTLRGREPLALREDFCGTGLISAAWARSHPRRTALGIDLDQPTLDWGREHVLGHERPSVRARVRLVHANVLDVTRPKVDLTCAMNFSQCVFKTRAELQSYLRAARDGLRRDGLFVAELYGGTEASRPFVQRHRRARFTYVWQQEKVNVVTGEVCCHLHFTFRDGSRLRRAFSYDWRLWSIPEMRDCLLAAGFAQARVYWENEDARGRDLGTWRLAQDEPNAPTWLAYVVGVK